MTSLDSDFGKRRVREECVFTGFEAFPPLVILELDTTKW